MFVRCVVSSLCVYVFLSVVVICFGCRCASLFRSFAMCMYVCMFRSSCLSFVIYFVVSLFMYV